ncbi:hypothetical protein [Calidithermus chliarophilus]|uniref:hypothetical protein n=1 Tax=Calidithermus chliarophilus TaxID=52023 RepID=UPI00041B4B12|nr:hypothetical protein [Calidithermus chliarophilus]
MARALSPATPPRAAGVVLGVYGLLSQVRTVLGEPGFSPQATACRAGLRWGF